jgi:acyl-CoA thioesterase II
VGDLAADTELEPVERVEPVAPGERADPTSGERARYRGSLSPEWAIWGPNGGYVASFALRAAGRATGRARPASIVAHILGVAAFDEVDLDVTILRTSRFASSARVSMSQGGGPILEALVWGVDPGGVTLDHDVAAPPDVPPHDAVPSREERLASIPPDAPQPPELPFFDNLEQHPIEWSDEWPPPGPLAPRARWWSRFRPTPRFDDPWVDACRLLIPIDTMGWPAASLAHAHVQPPQAVAVTVDLSVRFHRAADDEWLLIEATSPIGAGGVVTATGHVWDRAGALLASGGQSMLCRPATPPG